MHRGFNGTLSNKQHHAIGYTSGRTILETELRVYVEEGNK
jgi:hypothetical protein